MSGDLERRFARLRQGDHLCLISEGPDDAPAALVAFLKTGLAAGDQCLFIGPGAAARRLEQTLSQQGFPAGREIDRGGLVLLTGRGRWLSAGRFDPHAVMDLLRQAEQQALDDGFRGLRIAWDMDWLLDGTEGAERRTEYEALLNRFLAGSRTAALCLYHRPAHASGGAALRDVLHTHPLAVLGEQVCPNAFYEPPEMVLGAPSPDDQVDWMIARLRRSRANEEKLEDLNLRLAQKRAELERADRAKEELLAILAHELRNPLGTISNALQVLELKGERDSTRRRAIDAAERQVMHLALLVDDLLEASRVTRGQIELNCEELDLVELVRDTVEGYRGALANQQLALAVDLPEVPVPVFGDRMRLSQALSNVLNNAAKFTPPGGHVRVGVHPAAGRRVEVTVADDGPGISPEVLPRIFDVFTQADDSLDRARGGLGMGLAVVKGLVEMHGGEVRAASAGEGQGSELTLRLPTTAAVPAPAPGLAVAAARHADRMNGDDAAAARRILVVEDNPDAAATLRDFLELSGHEVELAASGTEGVRAARQFHPEVVLCDLGLPGMTGFEVAAQLRRDPETSSAQLIAVTGYGQEEDRRRSKEAGFDLHLTKPVNPSQLRQLLQTPAPARQAH